MHQTLSSQNNFHTYFQQRCLSLHPTGEKRLSTYLHQWVILRLCSQWMQSCACSSWPTAPGASPCGQVPRGNQNTLLFRRHWELYAPWLIFFRRRDKKVYAPDFRARFNNVLAFPWNSGVSSSSQSYKYCASNDFIFIFSCIDLGYE